MFLYLLLINALACLVMCLDKFFAKHDLRRIPEATLLGLAAVGGSFGALLGMLLVRHKTRKPKFYITLPVLFALHIVLFSRYFYA